MLKNNKTVIYDLVTTAGPAGFFFLKIFQSLVASCAGGSNDWDCCSDGSPCNKGEGDCDLDSQCALGLKCGTDNCRNFNPAANPSADCCYEPGEISEKKKSILTVSLTII